MYKKYLSTLMCADRWRASCSNFAVACEGAFWAASDRAHSKERVKTSQVTLLTQGICVLTGACCHFDVATGDFEPADTVRFEMFRLKKSLSLQYKDAMRVQ